MIADDQFSENLYQNQQSLSSSHYQDGNLPAVRSTDQIRYNAAQTQRNLTLVKFTHRQKNKTLQQRTIELLTNITETSHHVAEQFII